jgi:hypothetical protein
MRTPISPNFGRHHEFYPLKDQVTQSLGVPAWQALDIGNQPAPTSWRSIKASTIALTFILI